MLRGPLGLTGLTVDLDLTGDDGLRAEDGQQQLAPPRTEKAPDAEDLTRPGVEIDGRTVLRPAQPADAEPGRAELPGLLRIERGHLPADHGGDQLVLVVIGHGTALRQSPVPQDGDPVPDREHLLQTMRDIEHRDPLLAEALDQLQQPVRFRFGQRGGRLVEDDDLDRIRGQHLGDLDELLGRRRKMFDDHARPDVVQAELVQHRTTPAVQVAGTQHPRTGRKPAHEHVLADRQVRQQAQLLVDRLHTGGAQGGWRDGADRLTLDFEAATVAVQCAGEHPDQGGLPGAVLACQAMHLTGYQLERNVAESLHGSECLGDVGQFEDGRTFRLFDGHPPAFAVGGSSNALISGAVMLSLVARATPGSRTAGGMRPWVAIAASATPWYPRK